MKLANPPVGWMLHEGAPRLVAAGVHMPGVARGDPSRVYPYVKAIVGESGGECVSVSEVGIREARTMTEELQGVSPCFCAATAVAGLVRQAKSGNVPREHTVPVNLTGGDRPRTPPAASVRWLRRASDGWIEERGAANG